jgi:excisionase family DNA binding protein
MAPTSLTTSQAAKIAGVSQQTIIRCFDEGRLKGWRIPGSRFRRVPLQSLLRFMRQHEMPIGPDLLVDEIEATPATAAAS